MQWWGRRDALCRSVAAALWRGEGLRWGHVEAVCLVFDDLGVITLDAKVRNNLLKIYKVERRCLFWDRPRVV